jgi:hypothetical protein
MQMRPPMPASGESAMQANKKIPFLAALCAVALSWGISLPGAMAQENPREAPAASRAVPITISQKSDAKRYFVEFRSRSALSYGHTFLVHGKLNANGQVGQVAKEQVAGLHPATESSVPWMIGHVIPVVSENGWSDGDTEEEYITARYRVLLTEDEYAKVSANIRHLQKNSPLWHAVLYNCNAWVGDVAKSMGLKVPNAGLYPEDFISSLASLNGGTAIRPNPSIQSPLPGTATKPAAAKPRAAKPAKPQAAPTPTAAAPEAQTVR